jgi:hypothetical protein
MVSDIGERIIAGENLEDAFARWVNTFDLLFIKWLQIMAETSTQRHTASIQHDFERAP